MDASKRSKFQSEYEDWLDEINGRRGPNWIVRISAAVIFLGVILTIILLWSHIR